ncbi:hypothetical protein ACJX0J_041822, partial [Zea mays]
GAVAGYDSFKTYKRAIITAMMKVWGAALAPAHVSMSGPSNGAGVIAVDVAGAVAAPIQGIPLVATAIAQEQLKNRFLGLTATGNVYSQEDKAQLAFNHYSNLLGTSPSKNPYFAFDSQLFKTLYRISMFLSNQFIQQPFEDTFRGNITSLLYNN